MCVRTSFINSKSKVMKTNSSLSQSLSQEESYLFIKQILADEITQEDAIQILIQMHQRGESADELVGMVKALREEMIPLNIAPIPILMDTCGTGGTGKPRFNVSTLSALLLHQAGIPILKHGNRSSQGRCGSFDLLEALGHNIKLSPDQTKQQLQETGLAFAFAPTYHPAFGKVKAIRQQIPHKTAFNLLGPLLNPGPITHHILGVSEPRLLELMAKTLQKLDANRAQNSPPLRALIVYGDGLDELTLTGPNQIIELKNGELTRFTLTPKELGLEPIPFEAIAGGDVTKNTKIARNLLGLSDATLYPNHQKLVALNVGAGLYLAGKVGSIQEGYEMAAG
jgi:anthranilate phosphoribosyltransferase